MVRLTFPEIFSLLGAPEAKILTNVTFCDTQTNTQTHRHSVTLYKMNKVKMIYNTYGA